MWSQQGRKRERQTEGKEENQRRPKSKPTGVCVSASALCCEPDVLMLRESNGSNWFALQVCVCACCVSAYFGCLLSCNLLFFFFRLCCALLFQDGSRLVTVVFSIRSVSQTCAYARMSGSVSLASPRRFVRVRTVVERCGPTSDCVTPEIPLENTCVAQS